MPETMRAMLLIAALLWGLLAGSVQAQDVLPVPPLAARVVDQTATLSEPQKAALEAKLAAFEGQAGPQIVLLLVAATAPEDIAAYAQRVGDAWKIGRRQVGDGLLVVVAKNDRTVRIEVAKALEGAVPDLAARQIIDRQIVPAFKTGDYAGGLNAGVDALMARIRGEGLPAPRGAAGPAGPFGHAGGLPSQSLLIFFFVAVLAVGGLLSALFGRKAAAVVTAVVAAGAGWWVTASVLLAVGAAFATLILVGVLGVGTVLRGLIMMGGSRGGGGGMGGGGGFSSGGGGNFGGGGASGRW